MDKDMQAASEYLERALVRLRGRGSIPPEIASKISQLSSYLTYTANNNKASDIETVLQDID